MRGCNLGPTPCRRALKVPTRHFGAVSGAFALQLPGLTLKVVVSGELSLATGEWQAALPVPPSVG